MHFYLKQNLYSCISSSFAARALKYSISKRHARGSNLEASVMALKTMTYTRSRLRARAYIYALASVREGQI